MRLLCYLYTTSLIIFLLNKNHILKYKYINVYAYAATHSFFYLKRVKKLFFFFANPSLRTLQTRLLMWHCVKATHCGLRLLRAPAEGQATQRSASLATQAQEREAGYALLCFAGRRTLRPTERRVRIRVSHQRVAGSAVIIYISYHSLM